MKKKKYCILAITSACLVFVGVALSRIAHLSSGQSGWSQVPDPDLYVSNQPSQNDIIGIYELTQQTITTNGLAFLGNRVCLLELRSDGSFALTNYPQWSLDAKARLIGFVSTTGLWHCASTGLAYTSKQPRDFWGVQFSDSDTRIGPFDFRGKSPPYSLMMTYGDGDEGRVMIFEREHYRDTTVPGKRL